MVWPIIDEGATAPYIRRASGASQRARRRPGSLGTVQWVMCLRRRIPFFKRWRGEVAQFWAQSLKYLDQETVKGC